MGIFRALVLEKSHDVSEAGALAPSREQVVAACLINPSLSSQGAGMNEPNRPERGLLGSGGGTTILRSLLEFLHGNEQRVCLPLQLHHHWGTHPAGQREVGETVDEA